MPPPRALVSWALLPLHERLRGRPTWRHWKAMRRRDRWSAAELERWHQDRLRQYLRRAAATVPYYRERVPEERVRGPADLVRFPVLDKAAVRQAGSLLRSESFRGRLIPMETGGSTGEPLRFFTDGNREASQLAGKLRARGWWGLDPGHRETDLWGSPIESGRQDFWRRVSGWMLGYQLLSAFELNQETMQAFRRRLQGGRADFVYGYASVLARYARFLEGRGEDLKEVGLRVAISTAEMLLPEDRHLISRVLACPVANEYGSRDGGLIAHECPHGGLHLLHDAVHVEILDADLNPTAPGEEGEVVVTNLHAHGFPMIRYRLGDSLALLPDPCPCGRPHPLAGRLSGRITDSLVRDDGTRVHGLALIYILREQPGVLRFRCVQSERNRVRILVVAASPGEPDAMARAIIPRVQRVLGPSMQVSVELVEELTPAPSGKHRYIVCEVADDPGR